LNEPKEKWSDEFWPTEIRIKKGKLVATLKPTASNTTGYRGLERKNKQA